MDRERASSPNSVIIVIDCHHRHGYYCGFIVTIIITIIMIIFVITIVMTFVMIAKNRHHHRHYPVHQEAIALFSLGVIPLSTRSTIRLTSTFPAPCARSSPFPFNRPQTAREKEGTTTTWPLLLLPLPPLLPPPLEVRQTAREAKTSSLLA